MHCICVECVDNCGAHLCETVSSYRIYDITKMRYGNIFGKIIIFALWFCVLHQCDVSAETIGDPYAILGVDRKATTQDIRRAYKKLVKEWCVRLIHSEVQEWMDGRMNAIASHTYFDTLKSIYFLILMQASG